MIKARNTILTTVATICMIGLTAGASYSGSGIHGEASGKRTAKQSQAEAGSAIGTGGITQSRSATETGASAPLPNGWGARETVRSQYTVERIDPQESGAAAGGTTGSISDDRMQRGTAGDSRRDRSTDGTLGRENGQTIDQGAGGVDDQGTGWMRDRRPGGTLGAGETGDTGGTMDSNSGDTNIGSEGRSEPRSGDTTGSGSSANPEVPQ